jgi:hypothetical protein
MRRAGTFRDVLLSELALLTPLGVIGSDPGTLRVSALALAFAPSLRSPVALVARG